MPIDWRKARAKVISDEFADELFLDMRQTTGNDVTAIKQKDGTYMVSGRYYSYVGGNKIEQHASGVKWKIQDLALAEHRIKKIREKIRRVSDITGINYSMPQFGQVEHKTNIKLHIMGLESQYKRYKHKFEVSKETLFDPIDGTVYAVKGYSQMSLAVKTFRTKVKAVIDSLPNSTYKKAVKELGIKHNKKDLTTKELSAIANYVNVGYFASISNNDFDDDNEDTNKLGFDAWLYKYLPLEEVRKINSGITSEDKNSIKEYSYLASQYKKYSDDYDKNFDSDVGIDPKYSEDIARRVAEKIKKGKYE